MTFYGIIIIRDCLNKDYFVAALWNNGKMIWRSTRLCQTKAQAQKAVEFLNCEHAASQTPQIVAGGVVFS